MLKQTLNHLHSTGLDSLARWSSVCFRTKCLWIQVPLQSISHFGWKIKMSHLDFKCYKYWYKQSWICWWNLTICIIKSFYYFSFERKLLIASRFQWVDFNVITQVVLILNLVHWNITSCFSITVKLLLIQLLQENSWSTEL